MSRNVTVALAASAYLLWGWTGQTSARELYEPSLLPSAQARDFGAGAWKSPRLARRPEETLAPGITSGMPTPDSPILPAPPAGGWDASPGCTSCARAGAIAVAPAVP